ncbi:hypothetical protein GCM10009098_13190 [Rheinheimera aquimaris]|uniref:Uncharacterized protein n=1 Tax=Rheinheimera aquimaris TaxID=412437 RepID=A0ABN1DLV3_9GAMM|nr:hypothetical protein [Rheinheimera aquimaris]MCB5213161.1 hypothetical protein [Rheinheimera aquimaris]
MRILLIASAFFSTFSYANSIYDDWEKKIVNVTEAVQHFGGSYTCKYDQFRYGYDINNPGYYGYYTAEKHLTRIVSDSITPRPVLIVQDLAEYSQNGFPMNVPNYNYQCTGVADLAPTFIENKVVGTRVEYHPIQPFPTFASYEYANCGFQGDIGIRTGHLHVGGISNGSSVVVKDVTGNSNSVLYSGPVNSWISVNFSSFGVKTISIKIDSGSTYRLTVNVPVCSGGGDDPVPV